MAGNIERFVTSLWEAWNSHDWTKASTFYAEDCIMGDLPSKTCQNKPELETYYGYLMAGYPDLHFEPKRTLGTGKRIASEWTMTGTNMGDTARFKATGKRFSIPGVSILEIAKGKIVRETDYWDMQSLLKQLELPLQSK